MLLRSISKHVKHQNWFAVFVDFIIVVFGVFLGIQIGNWNSERLTNNRTLVLTERLADDFGADIWVASSFLYYHQTVIKNAKIVLADITNKKHVSDNELLVTAFRASQFNRYSKSSTYKELVSNGGFELIAQSELGKAAAIFYENVQSDDIQQDGKSSEYRRMYRTVIPIEVQLQAAKLCGDGDKNSFENLINKKGKLSYDCKLTLSESQLSEAASILRSRPEFADVLRRRIANLSTQVHDFEAMLKIVEPFRLSIDAFKKSRSYSYYGFE